MMDEPEDGALVLARYSSPRGDDFAIMWERADRNDNQRAGDWWQIRVPSAYCTHCRTTRQLGVAGPKSWGEVCGLDDPEPYGLSQTILVEATP